MNAKVHGKLILGLLMLAAGILLTVLVISAEIGIPLAIAGLAVMGFSGGAAAAA